MSSESHLCTCSLVWEVAKLYRVIFPAGLALQKIKKKKQETSQSQANSSDGKPKSSKVKKNEDPAGGEDSPAWLSTALSFKHQRFYICRCGSKIRKYMQHLVTVSINDLNSMHTLYTHKYFHA